MTKRQRQVLTIAEVVAGIGLLSFVGIQCRQYLNEQSRVQGQIARATQLTNEKHWPEARAAVADRRVRFSRNAKLFDGVSTNIDQKEYAWLVLEADRLSREGDWAAAQAQVEAAATILPADSQWRLIQENTVRRALEQVLMKRGEFDRLAAARQWDEAGKVVEAIGGVIEQGKIPRSRVPFEMEALSHMVESGHGTGGESWRRAARAQPSDKPTDNQKPSEDSLEKRRTAPERTGPDIATLTMTGGVVGARNREALYIAKLATDVAKKQFEATGDFPFAPLGIGAALRDDVVGEWARGELERIVYEPDDRSRMIGRLCTQMDKVELWDLRLARGNVWGEILLSDQDRTEVRTAVLGDSILLGGAIERFESSEVGERHKGFTLSGPDAFVARVSQIEAELDLALASDDHVAALDALGRLTVARGSVDDVLSGRGEELWRAVLGLARTCPECFGDGEAKCRFCGGRGYAFNDRVCRNSRCNGAGKYACTVCNGTQQVTCPKCSGRGYEVITVTSKQGLRVEEHEERQTCSRCSGTKTVPCHAPGCKDGKVKCTTCDGTGHEQSKVPCAKCKSAKHVVCEGCGGTGKRAFE